jgi:hypothetical protein
MSYRQSSENGARELLRSILSERQWNQFEQSGNLEIAAKGGIYRIRPNGPTQLLDSETRRPVATTRWQSATAASARDRVIAEYLLIRNDENLYWQTANICPPPASGARLYFSFLMAAVDAMLLMILLAQFR